MGSEQQLMKHTSAHTPYPSLTLVATLQMPLGADWRKYTLTASVTEKQSLITLQHNALSECFSSDKQTNTQESKGWHAKWLKQTNKKKKKRKEKNKTQNTRKCHSRLNHSSALEAFCHLTWSSAFGFPRVSMCSACYPQNKLCNVCLKEQRRHSWEHVGGLSQGDWCSSCYWRLTTCVKFSTTE